MLPTMAASAEITAAMRRRDDGELVKDRLLHGLPR
jgi:hypothetical protein